MKGAVLINNGRKYPPARSLIRPAYCRISRPRRLEFPASPRTGVGGVHHSGVHQGKPTVSPLPPRSPSWLRPSIFVDHGQSTGSCGSACGWRYSPRGRGRRPSPTAIVVAYVVHGESKEQLGSFLLNRPDAGTLDLWAPTRIRESERLQRYVNAQEGECSAREKGTAATHYPGASADN
ncbi:hypothetical protein R1flu_014423 [Riccia fluitans]|uniref:Uncharacterized protein n=1 Tax=Riccia fluitans TaxID=41844 RepID=A0ABD1YJU7_9MARC